MTEDQILQGLWQQDQAAFDLLYSKLFRKFCAFANNLINDPVEAGDQASDAFIKLWIAKKKFTSLDHINHFLFTVVKHGCISHIRKNRRHTRLEKRLTDISNLSDVDVEMKFLEADVFSKIYTHIEELPQMRQIIFKMTYLEGLSRSEVAEKLGISENTVKNQNYEALKSLRISFGVQKSVIVAFLALLLTEGGK